MTDASLDRDGSAGAGQKALYVVGLVATIAATVVITRISRQALTRALDRAPPASAARELHT